MEDDRADEVAPPTAPFERRRVARLVLLAAVVLATVLLLEGWHARAVDVELVHRFPDGDRLLPAQVEVQVWDDDVLHADAFFPGPRSLRELRHRIRVPPGQYRVTLTVARHYGEPDVELVETLTIEDEGSYYLEYELRP